MNRFWSVLRRYPVAVAAALTIGSCDDALAPDDGGYPLIENRAAAQLTAEQRLAHEEDAVRLAVRHLADIRSPALRDVEPPARLVASLFNALVQVHASSHAARDSVVDLYRIHTFPEPATREIMVRVDPTHRWTHAWKALNAKTGNSAVDTLVTRYELSVRQYYEWSIGEVAVLRAARPLHAAALAARFAPITGVIWAERNGAGGDGNDIRARPHSGGWRLDYSVGFGDCPAGCIGRHTWSFAVGADGAVRYLGSSGPPPPPPRQS